MLVYKLMVLSPVMLMTVIAIHARTYYDPYTPIRALPEDEAAINAYGPITKKTASFLSRRQHVHDYEGARKLALEWIHEADCGRLKALNPTALDDTSQDGAKADIFMFRSRLAQEIALNANREEALSDPTQAIRDMLLSMRLQEVGKYSDLQSVYQAATAQRQTATWLRSLVSKASPSAAQELQRGLRKLIAHQDSLEPLKVRVRHLVIEDRSRKGQRALPIEEAKMMATFDATGPDRLRNTLPRPGPMLASNDDTSLPKFYSALWLGVHHQSMLLDELKGLLSGTSR